MKRSVAIVGLGYVGFPMLVEFAMKNIPICGYDINSNRIQSLNRGIDETQEVSPERMKSKKLSLNAMLTDDIERLKRFNCNFYIIAVPTPIDKNKRPDLTPLFNVSKSIGSILKPGDIVCYESTVYPGCTEEDCVPILERESRLICGKDFFVAYSPERINPGDKEHPFSQIKKVVSGQTPKVLDIVAEVYESVVEAGVFRASSIKVAEASKVIENTQRDLNIALMNELSMILNRMKIDTYDVLEAAKTKWNFLPFQPGLVGGHCIGVDPYYLIEKSIRCGYTPEVIGSGRSVNEEMGKYIAQQTIKEAMKRRTFDQQIIVSILGFTFKENCSDTRNTRVMDIIEELRTYGAKVQVFDPIANKEEVLKEYGIALNDFSFCRRADATIIAVAHREYVERGWRVVDTFTKDDGVVMDIKGILDKNNTHEANSRLLWRL